MVSSSEFPPHTRGPTLVLLCAFAISTALLAAPGQLPAADPHPPTAPSAGASPSPEMKSAANESQRELVRRYGNVRSSTFFDTTTDGSRLLIGTRFGETEQIHLVTEPLGMRTQLTYSEQAIETARFYPQDPNIVLYLQAAPGTDHNQIFKLDRRTARTVRLTDGKSHHSDLQLARDGARLAWASNARAGSESDVYVAEASAPDSPKRLTALPGLWRPLEFTPNGRMLLVVHQRSPGDAELFAVPVDGSAKKKLWPQEGTASVRSASFSADAHDLFLVTDKFGDAEELIRIDPDHPEKPARRLSTELKWDVDALAPAQDRGAPFAAALTVSQGGYDRLYLLEPGTLKLVSVSLPPGVVTAMRFPTTKSDVLFIGLTSPNRPEDVYRLDVRSLRLTRWTQSELGPIDASTLIDPQRVSWLSDGVEIPALFYRPPNDAGGRLPVLIMLGRGEGQRSLARPGFDAPAQLIANELNVAVLEPGLRGSLSLGHKHFGDTDPARLQAEQEKDLTATLDWIAAQPDLDSSRVALIAGDPAFVKAAEANASKRIRAAAAADGRDLKSLISWLREKQLARPENNLTSR